METGSGPERFSRMNLDSALEIAPNVFSASYFEARQKFLTTAPASKPYQSTTTGPSGELLFTDAAYFGCADAERLLVLVSGTHGTEGYCGSAAQLLFVRALLHGELPRSVAVLLVHALNCYGFAWDRRVTAEGCDLNRNFVDFSQPLPRNSGYDELAEHLVPRDRSPDGMRHAERVIAAFRAQHGEVRFQQARKAGQYTRPGGMFYGGAEPTEARRTLEQIVGDFNVPTRERVVVIDYHTGLGPYGYGELQCEQASGPDGYERALRIFGPSVTSPDLGTSSSIALHGTQAEFWERALGDRHTYVALEFGTYDIERARKVVGDDHWLFLYRPDEVDSGLGRQIRKAARAHYYPERPDWMEMVISRSHQVHRQAIESLASER
jgi:hypothetical protein